MRKKSSDYNQKHKKPNKIKPCKEDKQELLQLQLTITKEWITTASLLGDSQWLQRQQTDRDRVCRDRRPRLIGKTIIELILANQTSSSRTSLFSTSGKWQTPLIMKLVCNNSDCISCQQSRARSCSRQKTALYLRWARLSTNKLVTWLEALSNSK